MEEKDLALARRLVDVDKMARGRALKKFRQWLDAKASLSLLRASCGEADTNAVFTELDMLKIMKAIYFCMWHADKPLIQEELAKNLASLIHVFKRLEDAMLFVSSFFHTMQQQWSNIDKLRLDKYYLLIREFLKQIFKYLSNHGWSETAMESLAVTLQTHPLELISDYISDGVKLHFIDIYIQELFIAYRNIPMSTLITLIDPFRMLATKSPSKLIRQVAISNIFDRVCTMMEKGKGDSLFADKSLYEEYITKMASHKGTLESCRNKLYSVKHKLLVMSEPMLAPEEMELPADNPVATEEVSSFADEPPEVTQQPELSDGMVDNTSNNIGDIDLDGDEAVPEDTDFASELDAFLAEERQDGEDSSFSSELSFIISADSTLELENGTAGAELINTDFQFAPFVNSTRANKKRKRKTKVKKNNKELHILINPPTNLNFRLSRSAEDVNSALGAWYNDDDLSPSTPSPSHEYGPCKKKRVTFSGDKPYIREFQKGSAAMLSPETVAFEKTLTPTKSILKSCMDTKEF